MYDLLVEEVKGLAVMSRKTEGQTNNDNNCKAVSFFDKVKYMFMFYRLLYYARIYYH